MNTDLNSQFKQYAKDTDKDLLAFFHALTLKQRKSLTEQILSTHHRLRHRQQLGKAIGTRGISKLDEVKICAMYVLSRTRFEEEYYPLPDGYFTSRYFEIFRPKWLQRALNSTADMDLLPYDLLVDFGEFDDCRIDAVTYAEALAWSIGEYERQNYNFPNDFLQTHAVTLSEHIGYLFTQPTSIYAVDEQRGKVWTQAFIHLCNNGKIDRLEVLKSCLQTANKNFRQKNTYWFFDLLLALQPTPSELHTLSDDFILALSCPHSKSLNCSLKYLKTLATGKDFNVDEFILMASTTLSSTVKSVVNNTLAVFDKLAVSHPDRRAELCEAITTALLFPDEKVQIRVAKYLLKNAPTDQAQSAMLTDTLSAYLPDIYRSVSELLEALTGEQGELSVELLNEADSQATPKKVSKIREDNAITLPTTFDEQIFFLTQSFKSQEPWCLDAYLQVLIDLSQQLNVDNFARLSPVFHQANHNNSDWLLRYHFNNCIKVLFEKYGNDDFNDISLNKDYYLGYTQFNTPIESDKLRVPSEQIQRDLLVHGKHLVTQHLDLPMLSMPTHSPCFIVVEALIERLQCYQAQQQPVNETDFQVALSRLWWDEDDNIAKNQAIQNIKQQLNGELADLMSYLLDNKPLNYQQCHNLSHWLMAVYRKGNRDELTAFIAHFQLPVDYLLDDLYWDTRLYLMEKYLMANTENNLYDYFFSKVHHLEDVSKDKQNKVDYIQTLIQPEGLIYMQYLVADTKINWFSHSYRIADKAADLIRLTPHAPDYALLAILQPTFNEEGNTNLQQRVLQTTLPTLMQVWDDRHGKVSSIAYQYLAVGWLFQKKPVAQLAAELWLQAVSEDNMNSEKLGQALGKLQYEGFAPLKRLTDLLATALINASNLHNRALVTLLNHLIANMHDKPLNGSKKLLEQYHELLTLTQISVPNSVCDKLSQWQQSKSLQALINKINKHQSTKAK